MSIILNKSENRAYRSTPNGLFPITVAEALRILKLHPEWLDESCKVH